MLRFIKIVAEYEIRYCAISIHPMLRFISPFSSVCGMNTLISIHPMLRFIMLWLMQSQSQRNFNTSHVTVYRKQIHGKSEIEIDFNTSHVTVYPLKCLSLFCLNWNFNTSHVTVYLMILSHSYIGIFHHFLYSTSFQHFLPADYKI